MNTLLNILTRRSVRAYRDKAVKREDIETILKASTWAPSGNNIQPWKFAIIMKNKTLIKKLASLTIYEQWVKTAPCMIAVFLDSKSMKNIETEKPYTKHVQAIGAAIQNILLAAHELDLGTCWIGEILKNEEKVKTLLNVSADMKFMALITVGYPKTISKGKRNDVSNSILSWQ
ncbi:nitroreductase family protein [Pectinatus sottacetonis]|uniref:nitroreductase family protein n=1 Tax=Pectinatus sottacetonis TaxID=1002795 RepID=UPI0018C63C0C|nr:nitroreductase family protein [Pectinatus sottacetonis]